LTYLFNKTENPKAAPSEWKIPIVYSTNRKTKFEKTRKVWKVYTAVIVIDFWGKYFRGLGWKVTGLTVGTQGTTSIQGLFIKR